MGAGRDLIYAAAVLVTAPLWGPWALAKGAHRTGWRERFGDVDAPKPENGPRVLLHAVSVGEVSSVAGLPAALGNAGLGCVVSTTTDTGTERAKALFGTQVPVVRFPFDWSASVQRFLDRVQPDIVALVELELWPNFVEACVERGIPVVVVSGRISDRSEPRYRSLKPLLDSTFSHLSAVGAQTPTYADRFRVMGTPEPRITVTDSLKWDAVQIQDRLPGADHFGRELGIDPDRPLVVAGSTGPGEEALLANGWPPHIQLLVAPRKPDRFEEVARALPTAVRRSKVTSDRAVSAEGADLFLLDSMGELGLAYSLADVAIVGRSFNGMGGSNPIEAAALGCATLIGPDHANFSDAVQILEAGGGLEVAPRARIRDRAISLAQDLQARTSMIERGRAVIRGAQGATGRTVELIERTLAGPT